MRRSRAEQPASAVALRRGGPGDAATISALNVRGWRWAYREQLPESLLRGLSPAEREPMWRAALSPGTSASTWVAEIQGRAVGFICCGPARDADASPGAGEVYALYLEEEVAGTGVGWRLMRQGVAELAARGFTRGVLWVLESNARGRRFYERQGWSLDGATKREPMGEVELSEVRYGIALSR
jgi:ribosomal protein S18 acetylase RimI-like enzyme